MKASLVGDDGHFRNKDKGVRVTVLRSSGSPIGSRPHFPPIESSLREMVAVMVGQEVSFDIVSQDDGPPPHSDRGLWFGLTTYPSPRRPKESSPETHFGRLSFYVSLCVVKLRPRYATNF